MTFLVILIARFARLIYLSINMRKTSKLLDQKYRKKSKMTIQKKYFIYFTFLNRKF